MVKLVNVVKKLTIAAIGLPLLIIGIILIPLPGPGLLVCLLALLILSLEFEAAQPYRDRILREFKTLWDKFLVEYKKIQERDDK